MPGAFSNSPQAFVVRDGILNDQRLDPLRINQRHTETYRPAVILHVKGIARKPERFGEMIHDFSVVIERVREFFGVWPITVSETGIVRRDQVVAIGETNEKRLEHSRGRRNSVQQQNRRRVLWPCLPVENRQPVDLDRAIKSRMIHGYLLSLRLGQYVRRCGRD